MFRIEIFVDDKNVGTALRSLAGIALEQPRVTPVINATPTRQGVKATTPAGSVAELFGAALLMSGLTTVSRQEVADIARRNAITSTANYLLKAAQKHGLLKRIGRGGSGSRPRYEVVGAKT